MESFIKFLKENKGTLILISLPVIAVIFLALMIQDDKETRSEETLNLNTEMVDANVDSLALSKTNAYNKELNDAELEEEKNDPYKTGSSLDFSLVSQTGNNSGVEQSAEFQAKIEELNTSNSESNSAGNKSKKRNKGSFSDEEALNEYYANNPPKENKPVVKPNQDSPSQNPPKKAGFNSITIGENNEENIPISDEHSINAIVYKESQIIQGTSLVFRTMESATINGLTIPKNTILNGVAQTASEGRLSVIISGSKIRGQLNFINFAVFDQDGMEGIKVPGMSEGSKRTATTYREQMDQLSQQAEAQLGTVGSIGRALLGSKNNSQRKVIIPDGYKVILKVIR